MTQQINSFRKLIELWPSRERMAADIGAKSSAVSKWWQRDSVPAEWWAPILSTDVAIKSRLRPEALIDLAARTPSEVTT
jgi:hypothetical protein